MTVYVDKEKRYRTKFIQAKIVVTKATCQKYDYNHGNTYCLINSVTGYLRKFNYRHDKVEVLKLRGQCN